MTTTAPRTTGLRDPVPSRHPLRIVIGAGGTGGHIYPALATADAIAAIRPDARISFSGTPRGLETTLVPAAGHPLETVPMPPLSRRFDRALLTFPLHLARSVRLAAAQLRRDDVDVVLGMGGYPSVPAVLAAKLLGIPVVVHESNAVPGLANSVAARFAGHVATGFDPAGARWCGRAVRHVGVPLAATLTARDRSATGRAALGRAALGLEARRAFRLAPHERLVVVSGGSLGARRLDRAAVDLAIAWRHRDGVRFLVKARPEDVDSLRAEVRAAGAEHRIEIVRYIERMDLAYAAAAAVVVRAGSGTVAELEHLGVPAVLVPYPHAPGDHQTHNALALVARGDAALLPDADCTATTLGRALEARFAATDRRRADPGFDSDSDLDDGPAGSPRIAPSRHASAADELARWVIELGDHHAAARSGGRSGARSGGRSGTRSGARGHTTTPHREERP